ncbi:hypothetical protein [uncultured Paludibaculum sp.]|uniref:hypothetical protein n=1 Tax=uncultured Paludibaculum sp. TaxID=1765020 RepID=UPI002AAAA0AF|nr:hypothetical protein [uncultured Paludibaculum sp.]
MKSAPLGSLRYEGGRPLLTALEELQARKGWVFNYEEPVWKYAGDMIPDPSLVARRPASSTANLATVSRSLRYTVLDLGAMRNQIEAAGSGTRAREAVVRGMIAAYSGSRPVAQYELRVIGDAWVMVPKLASDASGRQVAVTTLLDVSITVPEQERSPLDTLNAIAEELTRASGIRVDAATGLLMIDGFDYLFSGVSHYSLPMGGKPARIKWGASFQPARVALQDFTSKSKTTFPWRLLCQPALAAADAFCVLGLSPVIKESEGVEGKVERQVVSFDRGAPINAPPPPPPPPAR